MRPVIAAVPRIANPLRDGRSTAGASPPWAPAPEPERTSGPYPVTPAGLFAPPPGSGLRVPGDVPGPPAFTTRPPAPDTPAAAGPATDPDVTETATDPDVTETATDPDITRTADRPRTAAAADGPDITTRQSLDFAAAPVATSYPGPGRPAEDATTVSPGDAAPAETDGWPPQGPPMPGGGPDADPNSIWDLAATDVFPVAPPQAPDDEAPGASLS